MNTYITAQTIKRLREDKGLTQTALADLIGVSSKAVSKWETSKGLPDISLIEPLSKALGVSVMELMSGDTVSNKNANEGYILASLGEQTGFIPYTNFFCNKSYLEKNDLCEYCQICGKKGGTGSGNTCVRFTVDTKCPECGKRTWCKKVLKK